MLSLANAFDDDGAHRLGGPQRADQRRCAPGRLHHRNQDRRRGRQPDLRPRRVRDRRHPRERHHRRGRDRQPPHHPRPSAGAPGRRAPGADGNPGRGVLLPQGVRPAERRPGAAPASRPSPTRGTPPPAVSASSTPGSPGAGGWGCSPSTSRSSRERCRPPPSGRCWTSSRLGIAGGAASRAARRPGGGPRSAVAEYEGMIRRPAVRGRRRRGQDRPARAARGPGRRRRPGAALGHRPEVRARGGRDPAAGDPGERRPDRRAHALCGARTGRGRRGDRQHRHAAQRGCHRAEGHSRRRLGGDHPGGRGDPAGGRPAARPPRREREAASRCRTSAPSAAPPSSGRRTR